MNHAVAPLSECQRWRAALELSFEPGPERTFVRRSHIGPLSVQRPLYPEDQVAHVYVLHPPGGMVGGDDLDIAATVQTGALGLVTTPGATKFYRTNGATSNLRQHLQIQGGSMEWFPQENIFFNRSDAALTTLIETTGDAAFAGWDIQCFGRVAGDEPFVQGSVLNTLNYVHNGELIFADRLCVNASHPLSAKTTLRGNTVTGTLLMNGMSKDSCELAHRALTEQSEFFVTCIDSLLLVRYLGNSAESAKQGFCAVWSCLRCTLNQRSPCKPRIWAT
ncbi:MAG: urease accessory protein UreD [Gammaproteobacteria bacterium]|nr:urease accessory protein UreD [Gammaproteobacteria bacterium]